jgi:hypothetical protein
MKMFRHHNVPDYRKPVAAVHLLKRLEKKITASGAAKKSASLIATRGDEMQILSPVESFETFRHRTIVGSGLPQMM